MSNYICLLCENYTYDCSLPCPKCGFDFKYLKKSVLKVKNSTDHIIYYDFSSGAGQCILPNETETINLRENNVITFFFHIKDENNVITSYTCNFYPKNEKCIALTIINQNGKYFCCKTNT